MATKTETSLTNLVINYLSESDYNSAVSAGTINENELYMTPTQATTDTKNTAGSTNTSSKIYLIGATSQDANPQTYSHDTAYVGTDGCLYSNSTKVSVDGHTHNYAGSSSAGGSATSAVKLDSSAGSSTQPIYFSSGKPTACSYTLGKSVPSDAVFTDTVYTHPSYTAKTGVPTANATPAFGGTFTVSQPVSDATGHITAINSRTITIPNTAATTSTNGLMSSSDKSKLDGIATGATKVTVDSALSTSSTNAIQNKIVATELNNKANLNHTHSDLYHSNYTAGSILMIGHDNDGYWFRPTDVSATDNVNLGSSANPFNLVSANILRTYDTNTTSNGVYARVYNNRIYRHSSSSKRYKENIKPIEAEEIAPEKLYDAEVVQFTYKDGYLIDEDPRNGKLISGFIVEDLEKVYPIAIDYNDNGEPEMWNVNIIVPSMLKLIQDQKKKIDELEARIEALEA